LNAPISLTESDAPDMHVIYWQFQFWRRKKPGDLRNSH